MELIEIYKVLVSVGAGLFVILATSRLTLWRERRKEYNAIILPLRAELVAALTRAGHYAGIRSADMDRLRGHLSFWQRYRLRRASADYEDAYREAQRQDSVGGLWYEAAPRLTNAIQRLLSLLPSR